ncbi:MAG: endonuclease [Bacteriovoracaceae bacterium]
MNKLLLALAFLTSLSAAAQERYAYYGEDFYREFPRISKDQLHRILSSGHIPQKGDYDRIVDSCRDANGNCYEQNVLGYSNARKVMFGELDKEQDSRGTYVRDVYCDRKFYFTDPNDAMRRHTDVNTEHTWPQSKFNGRFNKEMQKSDLHHLYPTDSKANSRRGNYRFGDVSANQDSLNLDYCSGSRFGGRDNVFSPPQEHQGNVARALFYFATRYNLKIHPAEEVILRLWDKMDPIDQDEIDRHNKIFKYQKVRNPFIDHPELTDYIGDF